MSDENHSSKLRGRLHVARRQGGLRGGMLEALGLAQKLQWLTDEILFLEQHLAAMMLNNRALQSKRLRKPSLKCYCCDGFLISI